MICNRCGHDFEYSYRYLDKKSEEIKPIQPSYYDENFYCFKCTLLNYNEKNRIFEEK